MDKCFPPLGALSLRDNRKGSANTNRHSSHGGQSPNDTPGKIEILQDLDLYYIRQIAHNLKVLV